MLANCEPNDYMSNDPALPTIATLRLEFQRAEAEHAALLADGMDWQTAGEPDEWACPPECDEVTND